MGHHFESQALSACHPNMGLKEPAAEEWDVPQWWQNSTKALVSRLCIKVLKAQPVENLSILRQQGRLRGRFSSSSEDKVARVRRLIQHAKAADTKIHSHHPTEILTKLSVWFL